MLHYYFCTLYISTSGTTFSTPVSYTHLYTGMFRDELENTLDLAIGEGVPANRLAAQIKKYLQAVSYTHLVYPI